jgi:hypothetical protein
MCCGFCFVSAAGKYVDDTRQWRYTMAEDFSPRCFIARPEDVPSAMHSLNNS